MQDTKARDKSSFYHDMRHAIATAGYGQLKKLPAFIPGTLTCEMVAGARYEPVQIEMRPVGRFLAGRRRAAQECSVLARPVKQTLRLPLDDIAAALPQRRLSARAAKAIPYKGRFDRISQLTGAKCWRTNVMTGTDNDTPRGKHAGCIDVPMRRQTSHSSVGALRRDCGEVSGEDRKSTW